MTEEELQHVEQRLREIARESGLGWVIDQADGWIAEGITDEDDSPPERGYSSSNYRGGLSGGFRYELGAVRGWSAPRRALRLSDRSASERVGIFVDALYRVLTELPAIEWEMMKNFAPSTGLRVAPVASVSFVTDQGRPEFEIRRLPMDSEPDADPDGADERAQALSVILLSQLRTLVGSA